jgi:beta-glucanase (GH16 family)
VNMTDWQRAGATNRKLRAWLVCAVLFFLGGASAGISGAERTGSVEANRLDLSAYRLTFDESFETLDVSAWGPNTRWIAHTPWNGDFGDAQFINPTPDAPFSVENGVLRIEARRGPDGKWRSGLLASTDHYGRGFSQQFGYFEMKAKLPKGPGLWPAFWLVGNADPDSSAELDIMEHYGRFPDMYESVVHLWKKSDRGRDYQVLLRHPIPPGSLYEDFHLYGASIDPEWIIFYFDRVEVGRTPTPPEFHRPVFILLNLAMGAGWPIDQTPSPSALLVDYVRAFQKQGQTESSGSGIP